VDLPKKVIGDGIFPLSILLEALLIKGLLLAWEEIIIRLLFLEVDLYRSIISYLLSIVV